MVLKQPETLSLIVPLRVLNKSMINEQKMFGTIALQF